MTALDEYIAKLRTLLSQSGDVESTIKIGRELVHAIEVKDSIDRSNRKPQTPYTMWNGGADSFRSLFEPQNNGGAMNP